MTSGDQGNRARPGATTGGPGHPGATIDDDLEVAAVPPALGRRRGSAATLGWLGCFAVAVSLPLWVGGRVSGVLVDVAVLLAVAQWWGLLAGGAGVVSFLPAAYAGLGTYAWLALANGAGLNPVVAVAGAALAAALAGGVTGLVAHRLEPRWVVVATLVAASALAGLVEKVDDVGRANGRTVAAVTSLNPTLRSSLVTWLSVVVGVGSVAAALAWRRSRFGLAVLAHRDDPVAAAALGARAAPGHLAIWVLGATATGMAGALVHFRSGVVRPDEAFSLVEWTFPALAAATIGGLRTVGGPAVGAALYVALDRACGSHDNLKLVIATAAVTATLRWLPQGVVGALASRVWPQRHRWPRWLQAVSPGAVSPPGPSTTTTPGP